MTDKKQKPLKFMLHQNWLVDKHRSVVGEYLNYSSVLENAIVNILMVTYCEDDIQGRTLLTKTLTNKLSLRLKSQSCLLVIKELGLLDEESQKKLRGDFDSIINRRNLLAHSILMSTDDFISKYSKDGFHLNGSDVNNPIYLDLKEHKVKKKLLNSTIKVVQSLRGAIIPAKELVRRSKL